MINHENGECDIFEYFIIFSDTFEHMQGIWREQDIKMTLDFLKSQGHTGNYSMYKKIKSDVL